MQTSNLFERQRNSRGLSRVFILLALLLRRIRLRPRFRKLDLGQVNRAGPVFLLGRLDRKLSVEEIEFHIFALEDPMVLVAQVEESALILGYTGAGSGNVQLQAAVVRQSDVSPRRSDLPIHAELAGNLLSGRIRERELKRVSIQRHHHRLSA
jgi:hypothetical protein